MEHRGDHELQQVHCVLLRYISQLKRIYHRYSALGRERGQQIMTRMQVCYSPASLAEMNKELKDMNIDLAPGRVIALMQCCSVPSVLEIAEGLQTPSPRFLSPGS